MYSMFSVQVYIIDFVDSPPMVSIMYTLFNIFKMYCVHNFFWLFEGTVYIINFEQIT